MMTDDTQSLRGGALNQSSSPAGTQEPVAWLTPENFVNDIISACDPSNWDAERNKGDYFRGMTEAYEAVHEIANEYQTAMYAYTRRPAPAIGVQNIEKILRDYFYTGEPGQHDAIKLAADAILAAPQPASVAHDATREALATLEFPIPFKLWADRIESTTTLTRVHEANSYRAAADMANINCFYDFEAKRLVALLRALASPVRADRAVTADERRIPIIEPIESVGMRGAAKQAIAEHAWVCIVPPANQTK